MTKLISSIVAVALLSGCAAGVETVGDFSTGEETALIHGDDGTIFLRKGTCQIIWPHFANSMIVDAGPVTFVEFCSDVPFSMGGHRTEVTAVFRFHAKAGHTYQTKATIKDGCMTLLDVTAGSYAVACEPYFSHNFKDLSTGDDTAVIRPGAGGTGTTSCAVTMDRKHFGFLFVDAGSNTIDVTCRTSGTFGGHPRALISSFEFHAQAGHTYAFSAADEECISLLDITSDESVIACESYEQQIEVTPWQAPVNPKGARIIAGGASSDKGGCQPTRGGRRWRRDILDVDAGTVTFDAICHAKILPDFFGRRRRMSSFEFIAEAGHIYTITAIEKECMSLFDITSEETLIACEPYGKVE